MLGLLGLSEVAGCKVEQRLPHGPPVSESLRVPPDSEIPNDALGAAIRRGRALLARTRESLPAFARSDLRCVSCHLKDGTQAWGITLVGVYSRFPQYRARNGMINLLEDRINDCFERSLNGVALPRDGQEMRDMMAYLAFISRGVAPPGEVPGMGIRTLTPLEPDTMRGHTIFGETCARCHGPDGQGTGLAPPLWGPRSFTIGAGMARLRSAAGFIRDNMPNDRAVVLTDQQAFDVAGYVLSQPRPDFPRKVDDWPYGGRPPDVPYPARDSSSRVRQVAKP